MTIFDIIVLLFKTIFHYVCWNVNCFDYLFTGYPVELSDMRSCYYIDDISVQEVVLIYGQVRDVMEDELITGPCIISEDVVQVKNSFDCCFVKYSYFE